MQHKTVAVINIEALKPVLASADWLEFARFQNMLIQIKTFFVAEIFNIFRKTHWGDNLHVVVLSNCKIISDKFRNVG